MIILLVCLWCDIWKGAKALSPQGTLFQCNDYFPGYLSFPNIPDFYFDHSVLANFRKGDSANVTGTGSFISYLVTYPVGCGGTVKSIQTCYQVKNESFESSPYLRFQIAPRTDFSNDERSITITARPSADKCIRSDNPRQPQQIVCCENVPLEMNQYFLLSENENLTFAVTMLNVGCVRMLRFNRTYLVQQHRFREELWKNITGIYPRTLNLANAHISTLLLLRLIITPEKVIPTSTTEKFTNLVTPNSSSIPVAVGVTIACLLIILSAILGVILFIKFKRKIRKAHVATNFDNATYGIEKLHLENISTNPDGNKHLANQTDTGYEVVYETPDEDVYTVPAFNESALEMQFDAFKMLRIPLESIEIGPVLGSGQFGEVHQGLYKTDIKVAVKTLKAEAGEDDRVKFLQEAAIMGQFRHRNVVTMHGVVTEGGTVMIVLELLLQGDLRGFLLKQKSGALINVDDHALLSFCHQIASGMAYLSGKGFVHRDLAARNILISEDLICKIADFGMSRDLMYESYYMSHGGMIPVKWTAPEALHFKKYSSASDVWSYGAVMYEIWSVGHKPFEMWTNNKVIHILDSGYRLPPPPGCPRGIYSIMINCWHPEPHKRPKFLDLWKELLPTNSTDLLHWSKEDKESEIEAQTLGGELQYSNELFLDLQATYKT